MSSISVAPETRVPFYQRRRVVAALALACGLLGLLWYRQGPTLLWAYNLRQAGVLMETGLAWPAPRYADSIPQLRDRQALADALGHIAAAVQWHPDDAYAHRLAGQIYLAQSDWTRAAQAFRLALAREPRNPLLAWEAGLAYEQMQQAIDQAPRDQLDNLMALGFLNAPGVLVKSLYCREGGAETCYIGRSTFTLPFAEEPTSRPATLPVIFLHAPAQLKQTVTIDPARPVLEFVVGLDPVAHDWNSDGATFRVWVELPNQPPALVYERTIDHVLAASGWIRGRASLERWAGQTITLVLETGAGPANDVTDDWYGWANITLTSLEVMHYAQLDPLGQMARVWRAGGFTPAELRSRGDEARASQRLAEAQIWYRRAAELKARP